MKLLRITSPYFCAGAEFNNDTIVEAAPIIHYMKGWSVEKALTYSAKKGWYVHVISRPDVVLGGIIEA